eukprot:10898288-Alexandrium_andersonii.AAC.1
MAAGEGPTFAFWGWLAADGTVSNVGYVVVQGDRGVGGARRGGRVLDKPRYGVGLRTALRSGQPVGHK